MNPRVVEVSVETDYRLRITFANGELREFDVSPYLERGIFRELKDPKIFRTVEPSLGSVRWQNGQDFCPDMLYEDSVPFHESSTRCRS